MGAYLYPVAGAPALIHIVVELLDLVVPVVVVAVSLLFMLLFLFLLLQQFPLLMLLFLLLWLLLLFFLFWLLLGLMLRDILVGWGFLLFSVCSLPPLSKDCQGPYQTASTVAVVG